MPNSIIIKNSVKINKDLAKEREKCTFNTLELTNLIDGGHEQTRTRRELESFFLDDRELMSGVPLGYLSHKEKYEQVLRKMLVFSKKVRNVERNGMLEFNELPQILASAIFQDACPLEVHFGMFITTIKSQGTEEQQQKWLPQAINCELIGTYAQTELGHGTFIRGLETTATYDPQTKEFILNSPTLSSYKWWPGALGNTATHAVILAQLYSLGQCHGLHMFVVPLRDRETHQPLPGIKIGDIGARLGMSGANNGYLGLKNVRIPKENMLMQNSKILDDGSYIKSPNSKLTYGTMVYVRVALVKFAADFIKKSVTIAVRYSAVRRQSQQKPNEPECQILDYLTQQYKLLPLISTHFAFFYTALWIKDVYTQFTLELQKGNLDQLPELHAIASCLKAVTAVDTAAAIETCRLACGGHGYMVSSGFPIMYGLATPMSTYEGENTVLLLQTARSLMKTWTKVVKGEPLNPTIEYLKNARNTKEIKFVKSIDWIIWALERISARKIELAWNHLNSKIQKGIAQEDAWNLTSLELVAAAEIYARTFIVKTFCTMISTVTKTVSQPLKIVFLQLLDLYGVQTILSMKGDLLRFTDTNGDTIDILQEWLVSLLQELRPNAVGIVDSFDLRDDILASALGAYDGNVYERLYEEAGKSPLNSAQINQSYDLYLKPFMKSKF